AATANDPAKNSRRFMSNSSPLDFQFAFFNCQFSIHPRFADLGPSIGNAGLHSSVVTRLTTCMPTGSASCILLLRPVLFQYFRQLIVVLLLGDFQSCLSTRVFCICEGRF